MASDGARAHLSEGPLYFFDQPTRRNRIKGIKSYILYVNVASGEAQVEATAQSDREEDQKGESHVFNFPGELCSDDQLGPSSTDSAAFKDLDQMEAYKRAAPQLLDDLARLLSLHKWPEKGCIPRGIVNILNYSWHDLTAGALLRLKSPTVTDQRGKSKSSVNSEQTSRQMPPIAEENSREKIPRVEGDVGSSEGKLQVSLNPRVRNCKENNSRAHSSTPTSFSISASSVKDPGWIIQPKQPPYNEPQQISVCHWVVERLHAARNPEKLEQELSKALVLRHYGDASVKAKLKNSRRKIQPDPLANSIPQIPEIKLHHPVQQKLHYRINDGSSFIYYPSGRVAVCQSHSGLPCDGFYTNVFADDEHPVTLATITAFGHGAVSHPVSSAITAVWDQDGGFLYDGYGNITKEWSWRNSRTLRDKIVIQLSDLISVRLFSGISGVLIFRCDNEFVQLSLSAVSYINCTKQMTEGKFVSAATQDFKLQKKTKLPAGVPESKSNQKPTPGFPQMLREVEGLEEPLVLCKRQGNAGRKLKKLQQRAQNIVENWLDYYCVAIGIKCPDTERMPVALLKTRLRREVQSAALPSLNSPGCTDAKPAQPLECRRDEFRENHKHLLAPAGTPLDCTIQLPRTATKRDKKEHRVTRVGPLQIHGNIEPESVILSSSPESETPATTYSTVNISPFAPSIPLTVCPTLLRAALQGEGQRRRCCCSAALMPVVTDLEYDALIMGQPPHSQQILVVCVTPPHHPHTVPSQDTLEMLYRRQNKHRTMPCTQCQMDSFRLVKYEMSAGKDNCGLGLNNILLQQRHNAAPGMVLMYIRGKLIFLGYIFSGDSCSARDLHKQISRSRRDYRLGMTLPSDYKYSDNVNDPATTKTHLSSDTALEPENFNS
ncbi:uncharacterized protein C3orf20-like isoform X2 [Melanotaenia boesemani]|uniref:uncharacterized protein C3orf20-like isoform X2 n=1 Tax=Melanotaenia boesemani TaxID=1250792 RepID=UPI001C04F53F|nr:uncharacterized protein C3orf20-like isoform X2 [Melanotaenia boesemani]